MTVSEKGFTTGEISSQWMEKVFHPLTAGKAQDEWRLLLLDGHSSHYAPELLRFAIQHKIAILAYPPHCTHALQSKNH